MMRRRRRRAALRAFPRATWERASQSSRPQADGHARPTRLRARDHRPNQKLTPRLASTDGEPGIEPISRDHFQSALERKLSRVLGRDASSQDDATENLLDREVLHPVVCREPDPIFHESRQRRSSLRDATSHDAQLLKSQVHRAGCPTSPGPEQTGSWGRHKHLDIPQPALTSENRPTFTTFVRISPKIWRNRKTRRTSKVSTCKEIRIAQVQRPVAERETDDSAPRVPGAGMRTASGVVHAEVSRVSAACPGRSGSK